MTLGNVNSAPVNFRALLIENVRLDIPSLEERVMLHYQDQFMSQIYRVLGSADFLGNPVGLFNNISSGVSDIFYEPYQGIVMHGNKDIGLGIARVRTTPIRSSQRLNLNRVLRVLRRRQSLASQTA
jgi:vacuolar protein sorting-associated protein 13A/C